MGQYHRIINTTKKETFGFGGVKLREHIGDKTAAAFLLLLCNSNGRGGGDFIDRNENSYRAKTIKEFQGSWIGDTVIVQGDYAKEGDKGYIDLESLELKDITHRLEKAFGDDV